MFKFLSRLSQSGGMSAQEAVENRDRVLLLDVRDAAEIRRSGKAAGAICIPLTTLPFRADPRHPDCDPLLSPEATICIYCAAGGRAASAKQVLERLGYSDVHNIGGLGHWTRAGGQVERG